MNIKLNHNRQMKISSINDLPYEEDVFIGTKYNCNDFCNRYRLLDNGDVEVQHIYRYAKPSKTRIMTAENFKNWLKG